MTAFSIAISFLGLLTFIAFREYLAAVREVRLAALRGSGVPTVSSPGLEDLKADVERLKLALRVKTFTANVGGKQG